MPIFNQRAIVCVLFLFAAVSMGGCHPADESDSRAVSDPEVPVIVLGIDGAEWDVIDTLIDEGELPNFSRLKEEGAYGHLLNPGPQVSPVVWSTFATGHFGRDHGILDFVYPFTDAKGKRPVDSTLRIEPAIWNIASQHDLQSTVIGYFVSYPAEQIDGKMITDRAFSGARGAHWLVSLAEESKQIKREVLQDIEPLRKRFIPWDYSPEQAEDANNPYYASARMVQGRLDQRIPVEEFLRRVTLRELDDVQDLLIIYFRIVDYVGHSLWLYHDPSDYAEGPDPRQRELLGGAVAESYRYVDEIIGEVLARHAGKANILLISDHGFGSATGNFAVARGQRDLLTGNHRPDGVVLAHGPAFRSGQIEGMTIMEVMPTLAVLLGLPVSDELPGVVYRELLKEDFLEQAPPQFVSSYRRSSDAEGRLEIDDSIESDEMEALRGLGYVDDGVQFSGSTEQRDYDFWSSKGEIVAYHMIGEITYALIQGDVVTADSLVREIDRNLPQLRRRVLVGTDRKIDFFREDVPGLENLSPAKEDFISRHSGS